MPKPEVVSAEGVSASAAEWLLGVALVSVKALGLAEQVSASAPRR
jgi:hypothetical protein